MRRRPSSRLLILDPENRVLLFFSAFEGDQLSGEAYWHTPGGGLEAGETYEQAAVRELFEETGIVASVGSQIARREFILSTPDRRQVFADERYFLVRSASQTVDTSQMGDLESQYLKRYAWWSLDQLQRTQEIYYPEDLIEILRPHLPVS